MPNANMGGTLRNNILGRKGKKIYRLTVDNEGTCTIFTLLNQINSSLI